MDLIALLVIAAEIAVAVIILFYVVPLLPMPGNVHTVLRALIVFVAIMVVLSMITGRQVYWRMPPGPAPATPSLVR